MAALTTWVDATPFRAHLRFLMAVGSLSAAEIAAHAGISTTAAEHLLDGRSGRVVRRISPDVARRLISVSAADVRGLRWRLVPTERARIQRARLRRAGHSDAQIAELAGVRIAEVSELSRSAHCSELLTVRLTAVARVQDAQLRVRGRSPALPAAA